MAKQALIPITHCTIRADQLLIDYDSVIAEIEKLRIPDDEQVQVYNQLSILKHRLTIVKQLINQYGIDFDLVQSKPDPLSPVSLSEPNPEQLERSQVQLHNDTIFQLRALKPNCDKLVWWISYSPIAADRMKKAMIQLLINEAKDSIKTLLKLIKHNQRSLIK